jgi:hypothetical protein
MEALGRMIRGLLSGLFVEIGIDISHLQLVDDTLLFCGANPNHLCNLLSLFLYFKAMSGLKTNLAK